MVQIPQKRRRRKIVSDNLFKFISKTEKKKVEAGARDQDNSVMRNLGNWGPGDWRQNIDYTIPVTKQFPNGIYPEGEF